MIQIEPISAFKDNYIWMLINPNFKQAIIIDPGDAAPVLSTLQTQQLNLDAILITHHHHDHTGGVQHLRQAFPSASIYAYHNCANISSTHPLHPNDKVALFDNTLTLTVMHVPGHTLDHIAFFDDNTLFCGDTLFSAGCGRLFEGSAQQLFNSLQSLSALPDETRIYCAHEYTLNNLQFAQIVEPDNEVITQRAQDVTTLRNQNLPSLPSTIALESLINPFLRTTQPTVIASAEQHCGHKLDSALDVFTVLRSWKDHF